MNMTRRSLPPFPTPIAAALGVHMVRFQELEVCLILAIGKSMHPGIEGAPPPLTMAALSQLSFRNLVALFENIPTHVLGHPGPFENIKKEAPAAIEIISAFSKAASLCNVAEARRNQLAHSNWLRILLKDGDNAIMRAKLRAKGDYMEPESVSTIENSTHAIDDAQHAIAMAIAQLHSA